MVSEEASKKFEEDQNEIAEMEGQTVKIEKKGKREIFWDLYFYVWFKTMRILKIDLLTNLLFNIW